MLGNEFTTGLVAVTLVYLLGSIPTAFLVTKITTGKDIRQLGGGNVGGMNTFKEVGVLPAVIVTVIDIGKGAAAVLITHFALHFQRPYVLIASCGAVAGHNWMPWLKFSGGKGMGTAVGAITTILLLYRYTNYPQGLILFFSILVLILVITRNIALSSGVALLALPFICWLSMHSGQFVIWSVVMGLIIAVKFAPTAFRALGASRNWKDFIQGS